MKIAVCDDEKHTLKELEEVLRNLSKRLDEIPEIHCFCSAGDFLYEIEDKTDVDIAFLDIELGDDNGIRVAQRLRASNPAALIIFMTGYYHYVFDVFEVQPFGFLKKPLLKENVERVFLRAVEHCDSMPSYEYQKNGRYYRVLLKDIVYFISDKRQVCFAAKSEEIQFYAKLDDVQRKVEGQSKNFMRVSQSVLVNVRYIKEIQFNSITVGAGEKSWTFGISQKYRQDVRRKCMDLWKV